MKARPIPFTGPMVRALLEGRKTQTRRIIEPQPTGFPLGRVTDAGRVGWGVGGVVPKGGYCPNGQPGDLLWVRETFWRRRDSNDTSYRADGLPNGGPWISPRYMPREHSRLTLEITGVRVERLQDISKDDIKAEGGCQLEMQAYGPNPASAFPRFWDSLHGESSWDANPWVWVLEFNVHRMNVDAFLAGRAA